MPRTRHSSDAQIFVAPRAMRAIAAVRPMWSERRPPRRRDIDTGEKPTPVSSHIPRHATTVPWELVPGVRSRSAQRSPIKVALHSANAGPAGDRTKMSSLTRMLDLLDLFTLEQPLWTGEQIMAQTGHTRPTTFRYLKELCTAGLLARLAGGYVLGAKSIKLDYVIRQSDPVLHRFEPIMQRLRDKSDCDIILASLLGDDFFATIHVSSAENKVSWPRGRSMPLTRGPGLVILASLSKARLRRLLESPQIANAMLDRDRLAADLAKVAQEGFAVSVGALEPGNVGFTIPVVIRGVAPAALVMVLNRKRYATADPDLILAMLRDARSELLAAYSLIAARDATGE